MNLYISPTLTSQPLVHTKRAFTIHTHPHMYPQESGILNLLPLSALIFSQLPNLAMLKLPLSSYECIFSSANQKPEKKVQQSSLQREKKDSFNNQTTGHHLCALYFFSVQTDGHTAPQVQPNTSQTACTCVSSPPDTRWASADFSISADLSKLQHKPSFQNRAKWSLCE